jgi:septal ring-binding cell division protein DamX
MAKVRKKRKAKLKKQSLARNVALLLLSVMVLAGVSILFSRLNTRPEYSYAPLEKNLSKMVAKATERTAARTEQAEPQKSSAGPFEYSYWDILLLQDNDVGSSEHYSLQIATFKSRDAARQYADEVEDRNHLRCEVEAKDKAFVVMWGNFRTREIAERYCSTLSGRLQRECAVVKL